MLRAHDSRSSGMAAISATAAGAEKVKLESISSQSFEHEADRAALEALKKTVGFDQLMRAVSRLGADQIWRVMNESSNIRLSERQVGSVYRIHREVAATLDLDPAPPIYLQHDAKSTTLEAYGETIIPAMAASRPARS